MGKGRRRSCRLPVRLSARDGEEEKAKQWAALREAFLSDRQVHPCVCHRGSVLEPKSGRSQRHTICVVDSLGRLDVRRLKTRQSSGPSVTKQFF